MLLCSHHFYLIPEHSHHPPPIMPSPLSRHSPYPPSLQPLATRNLPYVSVGCCYVCVLSHIWLFSTPPGSSVHGILQARILEWVSISSYGGSSQPRDWACVSCIKGRFFTTEPPGKPMDLFFLDISNEQNNSLHIIFSRVICVAHISTSFFFMAE